MDKPVVWVVGDAMVDVTVASPHFRRTPEDLHAPVLPLPNPADPKLPVAPGGAANVAANAAAMGCQVTLFAPISDVSDPYAHRLCSKLNEAGVVTAAVPATGTTVKVRYTESGRLVGRADIDHKATPVRPTQAIIASSREPAAVILTDYGKGAVDAESASTWVRWCHARGIPVFADPKEGRQDVWNGLLIDVMVCNWVEALGCRAGIRDLEPSDDAWAKTLATACRAAWGPFTACVVKRGPYGSVWAYKPIEWGGKSTRPAEVGLVPAVDPHRVYDVQGAGDTYIAGLVAAHCRGATLADACLYASAAAGVAVGQPGTAIVPHRSVVAALRKVIGHSRGVIDRVAAEKLCHRLTTMGFVCGLTNGCFQLLHPGHVAVLQGAATRCDYLFAAVDSDIRVRTLKGPGNPVVSGADRVGIVSAVAGVDAAFLFDEDVGPLVRQLRPGILVKGGDYTVADMAGAEYVGSWGGRAEVIPLVPAEHNRDLIARIRGTTT